MSPKQHYEGLASAGSQEKSPVSWLVPELPGLGCEKVREWVGVKGLQEKIVLRV